MAIVAGMAACSARSSPRTWSGADSARDRDPARHGNVRTVRSRLPSRWSWPLQEHRHIRVRQPIRRTNEQLPSLRRQELSNGTPPDIAFMPASRAGAPRTWPREDAVPLDHVVDPGAAERRGRALGGGVREGRGRMYGGNQGRRKRGGEGTDALVSRDGSQGPRRATGDTHQKKTTPPTNQCSPTRPLSRDGIRRSRCAARRAGR